MRREDVSQFPLNRSSFQRQCLMLYREWVRGQLCERFWRVIMATDSTDPGDLEVSRACCMWCGKVSDSSWFCGSPECKAKADRERDEILAAEAKWWRNMERKGVLVALNDRCKSHDEFTLNRLQRWFYVVKFLICFSFGLRKEPTIHWPACVDCGIISNQSGGYGWDCYWMTVGRGVFTGWWFKVQHDGDTYI